MLMTIAANCLKELPISFGTSAPFQDALAAALKQQLLQLAEKMHACRGRDACVPTLTHDHRGS